MKTITPDQQLILIGLFMLDEDLERQQTDVSRSISRIIGERMLGDRTPDGVGDALWASNGSIQDRVAQLLKSYEIEVVEPTPAVIYPEFFAYKIIEASRVWLREFGKDETLETHYLTKDLARIPVFVEWVNYADPFKARDEYLRNETLQLEHRNIVLAALQGGFNPYV